MSRRVAAGSGALILSLMLAFTPGSAFAAGTHHRAARLATHSLRADATVLLAPGAGYDLRLGSAQVRTLQRKLDRAGFASGPVDGLYGPLTTEAVRRFQQAHRLVVDGLAGPRTLAAFRTVVLVPGSGFGLKTGSMQVRALQHNLDRAGCASGPADGLYGPLTTEAVRRFQRARGLPVTGVSGPRTLMVLQSYLNRPTGQAHPVGVWHNPVPRPVHRIPVSRRILPPPPTPPFALPAPGQRSVVPNLDTTQLLLALLVLGLLTATGRYRAVRRRVRSQADPSTRRPPSAGSVPTWTRFVHPGGRSR